MLQITGNSKLLSVVHTKEASRRLLEGVMTMLRDDDLGIGLPF